MWNCDGTLRYPIGLHTIQRDGVHAASAPPCYRENFRCRSHRLVRGIIRHVERVPMLTGPCDVAV